MYYVVLQPGHTSAVNSPGLEERRIARAERHPLLVASDFTGSGSALHTRQICYMPSLVVRSVVRAPDASYARFSLRRRKHNHTPLCFALPLLRATSPVNNSVRPQERRTKTKDEETLFTFSVPSPRFQHGAGALPGCLNSPYSFLDNV